MQAIVSDIHANLEAFLAVSEDIQRRGVTDVICLGDVIGYGPDPRECLDRARDFQLCLLGDHEEAVLFEAQAEGFDPRAITAVRWTAK
jgi:predicted phosphodiesterase